MNEYKWYDNDLNNYNSGESNNTINSDETIKRINVLPVILLTTIFTSMVFFLLFALIVLPRLEIRKITADYITETNSPKTNNVIIDDNNMLKIVDVNSISKAVVNVSMVGSGSFFGQSTALCSGNGVFISNDGYILTSAYILESNGDLIVTDINNEEYNASVVGVDRDSYIAVIKIDGIQTPNVSIGDSESVLLGDSVIGVGNRVSADLANPITFGRICGYNSQVTLKDGSMVNVLQTDATALASSIGGLMFNNSCELIGMSTAKFTVSSTDIALITPINDLKASIEAIIGNTELPKTQKLGISGSDADYGVNVDNVVSGSLADKAGIKHGDLIIKINEEPVNSLSEINKIKSSLNVGDTMNIVIYRNGETIICNIVLE